MDDQLLPPAPTDDHKRRKDDSAAHLQRRLVLAGCIAGTIVCGLVSSVARKGMYDAWGQKYTFFRQELTNLLYNIWATTILSVCAFRSPTFRRSIAESARAFPWYKLLIPAAMDGLADFLSSVGGPSTPGDWSVLLGQLSVFFTMAFSAVFLRSRFSPIQILGAIAVVGGASLAIFPVLFGGSCHCAAGYVAIFFLSDIPQSGSQVYKDYAFKSGIDLNVLYLTCVVSWFQLGITWMYLPLQSLPQLGGFDLASIPEVFSDGLSCLMGDSSIPVVDKDNMVTGECGLNVPLVTLIFSISGFMEGIFALLVMKQGSATLSVLTSAVRLPLSDLIFCWPAVMTLVSVHPSSFSWYNLGGLALVVAGFVGFGLRGLGGEHRVHKLSLIHI
eukprot:TRINITY_DN1931_c0_g1_i16.p1 TRINITY_DN1931_c0_g1~~TRINITY_DN1931_c0_g1_i16.p1  ORF type:complete len:387 (-),score=77.09 TRINITY_DN1931_c0_g1_i16:136-1296(-)